MALDLLGCVLVHDSPEGRTTGVIVETEAYRPDDPACHAYKNVGNMRNRTIFSPPGFAYVYLSYGIHKLVNLVCEDEGVGSAVLVRAVRPLEGRELMEERRGKAQDLCNGPGKLTQAFGITLDYDGVDLTNGALNVQWGEAPETEIISTTRIGISRGTELPWRYLVLGDGNISVKPKEISNRRLQRLSRSA